MGFKSTGPYLFSSTDYRSFMMQILKTRVVKKNLNPEWNEDLTFFAPDPNFPIKLFVYDKDRFSLDDPMGDAEFEIEQFLEALKFPLEDLPSGTIISRILPNRQNCLAKESDIVWTGGKLVQNMVLRLRNVECGEVELQLHWIDVSGSSVCSTN